MNYNYIVNPLTNRKCSIHSNIGKKILSNYINQQGGYSRKFTQYDLASLGSFDWPSQGPADCCLCNFYLLGLITKELSIKLAQINPLGIANLKYFSKGLSFFYPDYNFATIPFSVIPNNREYNKKVLDRIFDTIIKIDSAVLVMGVKPDINHCISFAKINYGGTPSRHVLDPQVRTVFTGEDTILDWIDKHKYNTFNILTSTPKHPGTPPLELNPVAYEKMSKTTL